MESQNDDLDGSMSNENLEEIAALPARWEVFDDKCRLPDEEQEAW